MTVHNLKTFIVLALSILGFRVWGLGIIVTTKRTNSGSGLECKVQGLLARGPHWQHSGWLATFLCGPFANKQMLPVAGDIFSSQDRYNKSSTAGTTIVCYDSAHLR
jgi:hypothetical protein